MADGTPIPSDASVSFTVKELIGRVDGKLDILINKVDEKASREHVERLASQVETRTAGLEERITHLEAEAKVALAVGTNTRWLLFAAIPTIIGVTSGIAHFFIR